MIDIEGIALKKSIDHVHNFHIKIRERKKERERKTSKKQWHILTVEFFNRPDESN